MSQRGTTTPETEQRSGPGLPLLRRQPVPPPQSSPPARGEAGPGQAASPPPRGRGAAGGMSPAGRYLSRGAAPSASRCRCGRRGAPGRRGGRCRPPPAGTGSRRRASRAAAPWLGRGRPRRRSAPVWGEEATVGAVTAAARLPSPPQQRIRVPGYRRREGSAGKKAAPGASVPPRRRGAAARPGAARPPLASTGAASNGIAQPAPAPAPSAAPALRPAGASASGSPHCRHQGRLKGPRPPS